MNLVKNILDYGAVPGGQADCTKAIQSALDTAGICGGEIIVPEGIYLTGALFVHSNTTLRLEENAVLLGIQEENAYPRIPSRVAGVEMEWPAGILNLQDVSEVTICGKGTIDGQGEFWWEKYWGRDRHGGMRAEYEAKELRWAVDYDCERARNIIVYNGCHIKIEGIHLRRSGFWNMHLCYSSDVTVHGINISDNCGPSTDGIDIDSCSNVVVENCTISCNDDNICLKSGRDADGLRVNRRCENVIIQNNTLLEGEGITLGSETSGGICNVQILNNTMRGTKNGLRIKSARTRGGVIDGVEVDGLQIRNVPRPFSFHLDWYPAYSYCKLPKNYQGEIPERWKILAGYVEPERGIPRARNIQIRNVFADFDEHFQGESLALDIDGLPEAPIENVLLDHVTIRAKAFGEIGQVRNLQFVRVTICCGEEGRSCREQNMN